MKKSSFVFVCKNVNLNKYIAENIKIINITFINDRRNKTLNVQIKVETVFRNYCLCLNSSKTILFIMKLKINVGTCFVS